jgi:hypothetical protein
MLKAPPKKKPMMAESNMVIRTEMLSALKKKKARQKEINRQE